MKRVVKLSESKLTELVKRIMSEQDSERYMFFSNLEQIHRQTGLLLELNKNTVEGILDGGHDWAQDHVSTAKESLDQVFDFMMNEINGEGEDMEYDGYVNEGRKKTGTKLCARGKAAAKSKFDVYPSAYANGYAVQVCKGKQPGLDGKKRCSGTYC